MELYERLCKNCGGDLRQTEDGKYKCNFCGSIFEEQKVKDYAEEMHRLFDEFKLEAISNARKNLYEAVNAEYISNTLVHECCMELKKLIPDDPQACFYEIATGNNVKQITKAIRKIKTDKNDMDIESIIRFLIRSLQTEFQLELNNLIARAFEYTDPVKFEHYCTLLSTEAVKVDTGIYETKLPREVFVAYSSKDMDKVSELVEALEAQGLKCFVAARNLRHGKGAVEHYNAALEEAMDHCRSIVFVSSTNSRSFNCDALTIELPYIQKKDLENAPAELRNNYKAIPQQYKKPRVEYRIGESTSVNVADAISNEIFDGYERAYTPEEVAARVMKQLIVVPKVEAISKPTIPAQPAVQSSSYAPNEANIARLSVKKLKFQRYKEGYSVSSIDGCDGDIIIPDKYNGLPVISIEDGAFKDRAITNIKIPDSVKSIGANAFDNCNKLMSAALGNGVNTIGDQAFLSCHSLMSIDLGNGVNTIGARAFCNCSSIVYLVIPTGITTIKENAFENCHKLVEIKNLSDLTVSPGTTENGYVGYSAKNVITAESGESKLREADGFVFYCDDYTNEYYCMGYYGSETNVTIPQNIDGNAYDFWDCALAHNSKITNIIIPNSVTSIGDNAFYDCSSLTSITIPDSVTSIGHSAFSDCSSLMSITIPDSITSIGDYAFKCCSSLTSITIHDCVTSIGDAAFFGCSSLTSITIPDSVTSIGDSAFRGCSSLMSITIPDSVTSIGDNAFYKCSSLIYIILHDRLTNIGDSAFFAISEKCLVFFRGTSAQFSQLRSKCYDFKGEWSFLNDQLLNKKNIFCGMNFKKNISGYEIYGSISTYGRSTPTFTIPNNYNGVPVTEIGTTQNTKFLGFSEIIIPDSVTSIGNYAFEGCSSLTSITIPDSVTSIGNYAFHGCSSLTSITIPDSITSIGDNAFAICSKLEKIIISKNVTKISNFNEIFKDSPNIKEVIFENPKGWQKAGIGLFSKIPEKILADPQKAAEALKTKYADVAIERK